MAMPLVFLKAGETGRVSRIGGCDDVKRHLGDLGFVVGADITIISSDAGNMIVDVKGSRLALTESMARHISI